MKAAVLEAEVKGANLGSTPPPKLLRDKAQARPANRECTGLRGSTDLRTRLLCGPHYTSSCTWC